MKPTRYMILCALLCANAALASDLTEAKAYANTVVYSNGQAYVRQWQNTTGQTIYITKIQTYVSNAAGLDGDLVFSMMRNSDHSLIQYIGWSDCQFMGGLSEQRVTDEFGVDCIALASGDGLTGQATVTASSGNLNQVIQVTTFIWYRLTP